MNDASQVVVGSNGDIYVGPTDATPPDDVATAMSTVDADWDHVGYVSEDGVTFTEGKDITDIPAWQSFWAIRKIVTARTVTASFAMRQWSRNNVEFALGGTVDDNGGGEFVYTPPDPESLDERSLVIEWRDGTEKFRLYFPRGIVSENVEVNITRSAAADLPVTFAVTDPGVDGVGDPVPVYSLFTNSPSFQSGS